MADISPNPPRKILILSVSAGAGHTRAAEAIRAQANIDYPNETVVHVDVMQYATAAFRKVYTDFYMHLVNKAPSLWGYLYHYSNEAKHDSRLENLRRRLERWNAKALLRFIQAFQADAIICTHFLPAEILSRLLTRGELVCPVWVQVTDFDLHRMWVQAGIRGYFAANQEVAFRMREYGIADSQIHVTGIPIMPAFSQFLDRDVCAKEIGCDPRKTTVMLMSGGGGVGDLPRLAQRLLNMSVDEVTQPFQLIVLTGKNQQAYSSLATMQRENRGRLFPVGFTREVERLMACADLIVTKPGGLTTSECLAMRLPMIVNAPIPGQEERNADYVLESGAAMKAVDESALCFRIQQLLSEPQRLQKMQEAAARIATPNAAKQVITTLMNSLTPLA
jgi:processive 1,2-diacylglycerol beta-glucosyltransferase